MRRTLTPSSWRGPRRRAGLVPRRHRRQVSPPPTPPVPPASAGRDSRADALPLRSVSVIVPCAGWPVTIEACLASLVAQDVDVPVEIVVVVNGPGSGEAPRSQPGCTVVHAAVSGPAAARNAGVRASAGDVLAFTDADCVADPGWLAAALRTMRQGGAAHVIAGAITRSGERDGLVSLYDSVTFLRQEAYVKGSGAFVTANLVVHRAVFERVGPFDPRFDLAAFEDWDWALRARRAGIPIRYAPAAVVDHPCMTRLAQLKAKAERLARGEVIYRRKHGRRPRLPSLRSVLRDHLRRAFRVPDTTVTDRLRLGALAVAAGFWRWRAFAEILGCEEAAPFSRKEV
jgi:GT2 family glycosyltransferase